MKALNQMKTKINRALWLGFLAPLAVQAQNTIQDVESNIKTGVNSLAQIAIVLGFIGGLIAAVMGVFEIFIKSEDRRPNKGRGLMLIVGGAILMAIVIVIEITYQFIFNSSASDSLGELGLGL